MSGQVLRDPDTVIRHAGGLENIPKHAGFVLIVIRHVGGLEKARPNTERWLIVIRHLAAQNHPKQTPPAECCAGF